MLRYLNKKTIYNYLPSVTQQQYNFSLYINKIYSLQRCLFSLYNNIIISSTRMSFVSLQRYHILYNSYTISVYTTNTAFLQQKSHRFYKSLKTILLKIKHPCLLKIFCTYDSQCPSTTMIYFFIQQYFLCSYN